MRPALLLAGIAVAAFVTALGHAATAANLKRDVTVTGEDVRLGDLFTGSDVTGSIVVARAPAPGQKQTLGPNRLRSIAQAHGVDWKPKGRNARSVITRAGRLIDLSEIEADLRRMLAGQGLTKDHRIEMYNRSLRLYAPLDAPNPYEIRNARFDAATGRFSASLVVSRDSEIQKFVALNGLAYSVIEIPVLNRPLRPGDVIERGDLEWVAVRADSRHRNAVVDVSEIVGQTPRRPLRAGQPIRRGEVRAPVIVAKGSIVTLELRTRRMTLSAKVKATEDGAMGQTIRLLNSRSQRTIEGVVAGPGLVVVPRPALQASASQG